MYFVFYKTYDQNKTFREGFNIFGVEKKCRSVTQCEWHTNKVYVGKEDSNGTIFEYKENDKKIFNTKYGVIRRIFLNGS